MMIITGKTLLLAAILLVCSMVSTAFAAETKPKRSGASPKPETLIPLFQPILARYDVYVGGIHLVEATILFKQDRTGYHTRVTAKTQGFWHRILPWNTVLEASGKIGKDSFIPQRFFTRDEWNHKPKITKLHFKKNRDVVAEFDPPNTDKNREEVTLAQRKGSSDPVTALLQLLAHVAVYKDCQVTVPVFDGKRRFDITGLDHGKEVIDDGDYNFYKGEARSCEAQFTLISGEWKDRAPSRFWQRGQNGEETGRDPFIVLLAPAGPKGAELAVKLESDSVVGRIVIHMTNWRYASHEDIKP